MRRLALFDLDNTLLTGDSGVEWLNFLIAEGVVDRQVEEAANADFVRRYRDGSVGERRDNENDIADPLSRAARVRKTGFCTASLKGSMNLRGILPRKPHNPHNRGCHEHAGD